MNKLAINGGTPVFQPGELVKLTPVWPPAYPETDRKLLDIHHSGLWSMYGQYEQLLQKEFAEFQDAKYAVWMCNGTTTLECALRALGVGPGDEVIVPGITWIATAAAALYVGATPVIVDIDPETLCIDPSKVEAAITPRTRAVIPVHLYSALADMDRINAIAKKHGLHVIEDCAHAHGAKQHGKGAGSLSDYGSFSFQLSKLMTAGEGGCLTTNDERLADLVFRISHIGNSKLFPEEPLQVGLECHQYRFTEFQAAIIYDQLRHQPENHARRQAAVKIITDRIADIPLVKLQKSSYDDDLRDYYFLAFLLQEDHLKPGVDRAWIFDALKAEGISIGTGWGHPLYKSVVWNVPQDRYVKHDTEVCENVMYRRLMASLHAFLMADPQVIARWAEGFRKVLLAAMK